MREEWKECLEGYYEVSNHGRVRRLKPGPGTYPGKLLAQNPDPNHYKIVNFTLRGKITSKSFHRLVAEAFIGPCPEGYQVNHKDGVKANNRVENLEYLTRSENSRHAWRTGLIKGRGPSMVPPSE